MTIYTVGQNLTARPVAAPRGALVTVTPSAGASASVESTGASAADVANGIATWVRWPAGIVSAATSLLVSDNLFIRVTATGGSASYEVDENPAARSLEPFRADWTQLGGNASSASASAAASAGIRAVLVGDSNTFQNFEQAFIASASRLNGVVTLVTSTQPFWIFPGSPIDVQGVPEDMRGNQIVSTVNDGTLTYTYANPGPDVPSATLVGNPSLANLCKQMDNGWFTWGNILSNQRFDFAGISAQFGRTAEQMLNRINEVTSITADVAFVMGGTNDIVGAGQTKDFVTGKLQAIYETLRASGKKVYALTVLPLGSGNGRWTAAATAVIVQVNDWIRTYCRTTPGMQCIDAFSVIVDPISANPGQARAGYIATDGLHLTQVGAYAIGKLVRDGTATLPQNEFRTTSNADNYGANTANRNVLDFAPWTNTGGTIGTETGTIAAGYTVSKLSTGSAVMSAPARADGFGYNNRAVITSATAGNEGLRLTNISTAIPLARVPAGSTLQSDVSISVTGNASTYKSIAFSAGSGTNMLFGLGATVPAAAERITEDWSGIIRTPRVKLPFVLPANPVVRLDTVLGAAGTLTVDSGRFELIVDRP